MLGGGNVKVIGIDGQFSRNINTQRLSFASRFLKDHINSLVEMYPIHWKANGDREAVTVSQILKELEKDGCPDVFLKTLTIIIPWTIFSEYTMKNKQINYVFTFHPHTFRPSMWSRLKSRIPSFPLFVRLKELRKLLSSELDDETKKRWRDTLLINYPHESLSNQEIRQIFANQPWCILLKESRGRFTLMEISESREVSS